MIASTVDQQKWYWCKTCPYATCDILKKGYIRCNFYKKSFLVIKDAGCRREKGAKDGEYDTDT